MVVFGSVFTLITDVKCNSLGQGDYKQENGNFVFLRELAVGGDSGGVGGKLCA